MPTESVGIIESDEILIATGSDVLGLIYSREEDNIIVRRENIVPGFFDLTTGIAGDVAQKLVNYRRRIAVVGDFTQLESKSLRDFIYESNKRGNIFFVASVEEARQKLIAAGPP
jgi:hypothetical protein